MLPELPVAGLWPQVENSPLGYWLTQIAFAAANASSYTVTGLMPDTSYEFRLRAYEGTINGEYSATAEAATFPPPAAPTGLTVTPLSTSSVRVDWTNVSPYQTSVRVERMQTVHARSSYRYDELVWGARFSDIFGHDRAAQDLTVDISRIHAYERVSLV